MNSTGNNPEHPTSSESAALLHDCANELHVVKGMTDSTLALLSAYSPAQLAELPALKLRLSKTLSAADRLESHLEKLRKLNQEDGSPAA